ncbi:hypothetical protein HBH92_006800 [Parastagonospora nodorum]|nr:hypothetical protein HBH50_055690 [Parastagonospora nodorum]KAH4099383.1 hypothetical protein HBH48_006430 [Parastagonospora nodorum]KAH4421889.1 hypothetical protein HBH92_006800 [Parastagonospora nodorum]KAH4455709.1 hypothetical protein HBH93_006770 [Parastagonospora nodorum]KAH4468771.1 hypothetical protein HBH91_015770 [Parastagonospora nodorum]
MSVSPSHDDFNGQTAGDTEGLFDYESGPTGVRMPGVPAVPAVKIVDEEEDLEDIFGERVERPLETVEADAMDETNSTPQETASESPEEDGAMDMDPPFQVIKTVGLVASPEEMLLPGETLGDEDEEMEDVVPGRLEDRVYHDRSDAPTRFREEMDKLDARHYPSRIVIGTLASDDSKFTVTTDDIFQLRGSDVNKRFLPNDLQRGKRLRTIVEFDDGTVTAGKHLELSLQAALEKEDPGAAPQDGKKGKGKAVAPAPKAAEEKIPSEEVVKAKFHLATQTPHIEITTIDPDTNNLLSTRIWAHDLQWAPSPYCIGCVIVDADPEEDVTKMEHFTADRMAVNRMAGLTKTMVIKVHVVVWKPELIWDGISDARLAAIRAKPDLTKVRDQLIVGLDKTHENTQQFKLFFSVPRTPGNLKKWKEMGIYFRKLLMIAKQHGNFWFMRRQTELAGLGPDALEKPALPDTDFVTPRWLATKWTGIKVTEPNGSIWYKKVAIYHFEPLDFPLSYGDADEAAFLLKLAVQEEKKTQRRNLSELVRSDGSGKQFRARFNTVGRYKSTHQYSVEIYLGLERQMADGNVKIPTPGTRIILLVDKFNQLPPVPRDSIKVNGIVVSDAVDTDASFVCVVDSGMKLAAADTGADYPVLIDYIIDDLPYNRQIAAIGDLQTPLGDDHIGPDGLRTIVNCRRKAAKTGYLKQNTSPENLEMFKAALHAYKDPPTAVQLAAALDTTQSDDGNTVIVGPPGTGKTEVVQRISRAHAILGRRVLMTAPTNAATQNLMKVCIEHNNNIPESERLRDWEIVYLTGGQSTPGGALKLMRRQLEGEKEFNDKTNVYQAHLRDAKLRDKSPLYHLTFGYKLLQRIETWASDKVYDTEDQKLFSLANNYKDTQEIVRTINEDSEGLGRAKKHLNAVEATLSAVFFKQVKFCFCTLSTSAHPLVVESGFWDELIIDEAARETRAGIATVLGSLQGRIGHVTWSGDFMQGEGTIVGRNSNIGYQLLARNVFEEIAEVDTKQAEESISMDVFTLDECFRMHGKLSAWSSKWCYAGRVRSHPFAGTRFPELRTTLKAYMTARTRENFNGQYDEIAIAVDAKSELQEGSTTSYNVREAEEVAWLVKDMLMFDPTKGDAKTTGRRIVPKDFIIITNYIGQVSAIRKALRAKVAGQESVKPEDVDAVTIVVNTTSSAQGLEENIAIYSTVVGTGTTRLGNEDSLGLAFVASRKNYNVSITRQRVARFIVGSFNLFAQALEDKHPLIHKHSPFFDHIKTLVVTDSILTPEECKVWREQRAKPANELAFRLKLVKTSSFANAPMSGPARQNEKLLLDVNSRPSTAGLAKNKNAPRAQANFAGNRDNKGTLKAGGVAEPAGVKKLKSKGKKHRDKRNNYGKDDDNAAGGAASAA